MTTKALADFTSRLTYEKLSPHSVSMAKKCLLDWLGVAISGSQEQPAKIIRQTIVKPSAGEATILAQDCERTSALDAAFCNGAASHSLDFDDLHNPSIIHLACVVIPAALALAEAEHKSGKQLLAAICAGYEAGARAGEAVIPESYFYWHTTGSAGIFGAAAAAANILGLDAQQTLMCYGSAGTQAAGLWEFLKEGAMSKSLHAGKAAYGGVLSACLARAGFTGASKILEGEKGFCRAVSPQPHQEKLVDGLNSGKLKIDENSFKPYACCKHSHAALYAIQTLRQKHKLQPADICKTTLFVNDITDCLINNPRPQTPYGCKFSIQYCSAAILKYGAAGIEQFRPNIINDEEILQLMQKTAVVRDEAMEKIYRENPSKLASRAELTLTSGAVLSMQVDYPKGDPDNPLSWEETCAKFMTLAEPVIGSRKAAALCQMTARIEEYPDMAEAIAGCIKEN